MPLRLDIKKKLTSRSERVKSVDMHPTEPWVLAGMYSGTVMIWNYDSQELVKSFEVTNLPVRNAKFISRKQWIVSSSDDLRIRVFNYNTMEKITDFDGHSDYIRFLEVHPSLPFVLSCADDNQIKLWDWEQNWRNTQVYEGHCHYVMMTRFNPKDTNTFASCSLDRTIKVWSVTSSQPHFSLEGHKLGINCIDYYHGGDKPYIVSGADDRTVKIWDYQTRSVIQTLQGHTNNITAVMYHPRLPLIISTCENGVVRMWHNTTYRAENTLNYGMERAWSLSALAESNKLAIGFDEGTVVLRLGRDHPVVSMDNSGKVIWAKNNEIHTSSLKGVVSSSDLPISDGERIPLSTRELGTCDVYPQSVKHNSNGRFVVVCGDGEYIIYTSQQLRNKSFGSALDFAWSPMGTGDYVIRESISKLTLFKNFKEVAECKPRVCTAEGLFGGALIGVRGSDCVAFYDWEELRLIHKIDVCVKNVYWSESGELVVLACDESYFVLRYNHELVASSNFNDDQGIEGAFELLHEKSDKIGTGQWVGDCFIYVNSGSKLNYYVGGEVMRLAHLERKMYMLGYLPRENRVYLMDKMKNVYSYTINLVMLEYQTAVVRGDFDEANTILPRIGDDQMNKVACFLESQGFKEEALELSTDYDQRFDLAIQLGRLDIAQQIMLEDNPEVDSESTETQHKWKQLGDLALNDWNLPLAEDCAVRSNDFSSLLLIYATLGNRDGMEKLVEIAKQNGKNNVAFTALLLLRRVEECIDLLLETKRFSEAAFFARTYAPGHVSRIVTLWRTDLSSVSKRAAKALVDPTENEESFPDFQLALQIEQNLKQSYSQAVPVENYHRLFDMLDSNLLNGSNGSTVHELMSNLSMNEDTSSIEQSRHQQLLQQEDEHERERLQKETHEKEQLRLQEEAHAREQQRLQEEAHAREQLRLQEEAHAREQLRLQEEAHAREQQRLQEEAHAREQQRLQEEAHAREQQRLQEEAHAREQQRLQEEAHAREQQRLQEEAHAREQQRLQEEAHAREQQRLQEEADAREQQRLEKEAEEKSRLEAEAQEKAKLGQAEAAQIPNAVAEGERKSDLLDFDFDNEDLNFEDDDVDWGDM